MGERRSALGAIFMSLLQIVVAEWAVASGLETVAVGLPMKVLWAEISYFGIALGPLFYFLFMIQYSQKGKWLSPGVIALLSIIPVLTIVFAATDSWHHLLWRTIMFNPKSNIAIYRHGSWFWVSFFYNYALLCLGAFSLYRAMFLFHATYRSRSVYLLVGTALPIAGFTMYIVGVDPLSGLDWTPITFTLTGIILTWGIFRKQMFSLLPIARNHLVDHMKDGVLVVDESNLIVDINQSAQRLLIDNGKWNIGQPIRNVLTTWTDLISDQGDKDVSMEITLGKGDPRVLEARISTLHDHQNRFVGRLVVLHDINDRKLIENAVKRTNRKLKQKLVEIEALQAILREQAIFDHLTGLMNRRFLEETLERELPRAKRKDYPVSISIIDIDQLKHINDKYGHAAGDVMLQAVSELLKKKTRQGDIICRYAGDEFVIVLPEVPILTAIKRIEQLRIACEALRVTYGNATLSLTLSIGIATFPKNGETAKEVLHNADKALYQAKSGGRNRTVVWEVADAISCDEVITT